jgi:hypothetical protein
MRRLAITKTKHFLEQGGEAALALLKLTDASADAFPPLKAAASGALYIADMVMVRHRVGYRGHARWQICIEIQNQ